MKISDIQQKFEMSEGGDYKDYAAELCEFICDSIYDTKYKNLIKDMPDGLYCPRSFMSWIKDQK